MFTFMPVGHSLDYCSFVETLSLPTLFFFLKIVLAILDPFYLHMDFKTSSSISARKPAVVLIRIALDLWISVGEFPS